MEVGSILQVEKAQAALDGEQRGDDRCRARPGPQWADRGRLDPLLSKCSRLGSVIDRRRELAFGASSGKQPRDLTRRLSSTTRSYSSRGLLIRYT